MKSNSAIVWFRNDLRLHDNEALSDALKHAERIIPIYVFDEREMLGRTSFGFKKTGKFRANFILEAVQNLRDNLAKFNFPLIVRVGKPEEIIPEIARQEKTSWVYCNRERTSEELYVQDTLELNLWAIGQEVRYSRGKMLYYTADLPFPVTHCPDTFSTFRKEVERFTPIREPLPIPDFLANHSTESLESGEMPNLSDLGHAEYDHKGDYKISGGEDAGKKELDYYLFQSKLISKYKETRNGLLGRDFSSKLSAYLSHGCLSPKYIYQQIKSYEAQHGSNDSTYWLFFELLWRDFFRLMGKKHENKIFQAGGTKENPDLSLSVHMETFEKWASGKTGVPFIDANMRELNYTGFMSNRGRQNVASFLVHDLKLNWLLGAEYMESLLIDYDPCSNYGNWNYIAGVGSDTREKRHFNVVIQSKKYDPAGEYIKRWIPELADVSSRHIHRPDLIKDRPNLGDHTYPLPMMINESWC
jgi:deoxyribodipyrimidine photo-lyase